VLSRPLSTLALVLAAAVLAACGGSGGSKNVSGDDTAIRKLISETSLSTDPSKCSTAATQRFLEQIQFEKGSKAVEACKEDAKHDVPAKAVSIASVNVDGNKATAVYTQKGGDADGQRFTVEFVKTGGRWRFDHLAALTIDRPRFDRSFRASLLRPPDKLAPAVADCSVRELSKVSDGEIEAAVVQAKPAVVVRPVAFCALVGELNKTKATANVASCAARKTIDALSDAELEASVSGGSQAAIERALRKALTECGVGSSSASTS
jgi:hypothetical protein